MRTKDISNGKKFVTCTEMTEEIVLNIINM